MTPEYFASLALETWRASGPRTEQRRDALLTTYLESYFGRQAAWSDSVKFLESCARDYMRLRTHTHELV